MNFSATTKKMFLIRPEAFGATVYDTKRLIYFFVNQTQYAILCSLLENKKKVHLTSHVPRQKNYDISGGQFDRTLKMIVNDGYGVRFHSSPSPLPIDSLAAPVRVYFEICLKCNANCRYCLNNSGSARLGELSTDETLNIIENLARDGVFEVRITGGEPTLRSDFYQLVKAVQDKGMALSVNSNLLVGNKIINSLIELSPNLLITSLDAEEKAHNVNRGSGYEKIAQHVHTLRAAGIPVRLNCMLNAKTLPHIERFIDEFAQIGCDFCFILTRPVGRAIQKFEPPPLADLVSSVQTINSKTKVYTDSSFSTSFHVIMPQELIVGGINLTGCNAIQKSFNINSDGQILPCAFLYELSRRNFNLGNIRHYNYSVLEVWRNSRKLRELRQQSAKCNIRCIKCQYFKKGCLGSCVFMELYSKMTHKPDPYCKLSLLKKRE